MCCEALRRELRRLYDPPNYDLPSYDLPDHGRPHEDPQHNDSQPEPLLRLTPHPTADFPRIRPGRSLHRRLHVTVKDAGGNLVNNATVTVSNVAKGLARTATGDNQGGYSVHLLPPGTYTVTVQAPGFGKAEAKDVSITVGGLVDLPIALAVAAGKEVVEVTSQQELIETSRTSTTNTIGQLSIDNLPINGRNYINFTLTDSQVSRDNSPFLGAAPTSGLNIGGQRARSNLVNVDGADATDNSTNGVRSTVSQEAVQEFQIITNSYAPEYGRAAGGVVNIITRSGSNAFHGDVFGFLRDRDFQAVNPFSTVPNPAYTRVQAGTAFGGPIKKDKTYYYFSYEISRRHETGFSAIGQGNYGLVPFDASPFFGAPAGTFDIQVTPEQAAFMQTPGLPANLLQAYAVLTGASSGLAVNGTYPASFGYLVAGGFLPTPANGTNPLQQFITSCSSAAPLCNGLPGTYTSLVSQQGNFPVFEGTSLYSLRIDHNVNANNRLTLRVNVSPSTVTGLEGSGEDQPFGQNAFPAPRNKPTATSPESRRIPGPSAITRSMSFASSTPAAACLITTTPRFPPAHILP